MSSERAIFTIEQPGVLAGNFALIFSLNFFSIFVDISGSIRLITLIWASMERCFPPAQGEYRWCQFWSKGMMSEVEERTRLIMTGYWWRRSQWVNKHNFVWKQIKISILSAHYWQNIGIVFNFRQKSVLKWSHLKFKVSEIFTYSTVQNLEVGPKLLFFLYQALWSYL